MLTAITGINWGDEGKGRMVDLISQEYDIVARYQGGNNAGHTVKNERGKFVLNLLPSGILRPDVVCVMGNGMVIDPHHLDGEINKLREQGISITPANLKISDRATITMPYHVEQDGLEEARLSKTGAQFGSTKRGIAYAYGDKYMKKTLRMGDLLHLDDSVHKRLVTMVDSKNLVMEGSYNAAPISVDEMWAWLEKYAAIFKDYICAGIPGHKLTNSIGVMKAYSSCVGDGPFAAELAMTEEEKHDLREAGHEYGAATGRPRRVGPIDLVASRYGVFCQGCDEVALTLLDVLDYMEKIPMVTAYKLTDGTTTTRFPMGEALDTAQPVVEYLPGWHCDITAARKWEDLPKEARDYVEYLEKAVGCKITYISEHYRKEGKEIAVRDFYQFMVDNPSAYPKTSLASIEDFEEVFRRQAELGRPTLCLCFTSKMSGCVGSARNARELVLEDYPDAKIEVLDSAAATVTEATMVENAVAIRDAGCTLDEAVTWLEAEKATNNIFFTVGNLDYLIKGGRIGKVSGRAANLLGIKPMILFKDGEIFSGGVARGRQKSFEKALEQLMNYLDANGGTPDDYRLIVGYGYDEEEGKRLWLQTRAALRAKYPAAACEVGLLQIGCTIAVHTGPYALGMGVMRRWKKQQ